MDVIKLAEYFYEKYNLFKNAQIKPEAPKNAPFGEFAWSKHRKNIPNKEYTKLEKLVYKDIRNHFSSKHIGLPKFTVRLLNKILSNKWYNKIIHEPKHKLLYRGLKLNHNQLSNLINLKTFEENGEVDFNQSIKVDNGHSSSWTYKKDISRDFSTNYGKAKSGFSVTLIANVSDNENRFIAGPGGLYNVDGLSRWHLEKETIGLEPIIINKIQWKKI